MSRQRRAPSRTRTSRSPSTGASAKGEGNFPAVPSLSVTLAGLDDADARALRDGLRRATARARRRASATRRAARARRRAPRPRAPRRGHARARRGRVDERLSHGERPRVERLGLRGARRRGGRGRRGSTGTRRASSDLARRSVGQRRAERLRRLRRARGGRPRGVGTSLGAPVAPGDTCPLARPRRASTTEAPKAVGSTEGMRGPWRQSPYARGLARGGAAAPRAAPRRRSWRATSRRGRARRGERPGDARERDRRRASSTGTA